MTVDVKITGRVLATRTLSTVNDAIAIAIDSESNATFECSYSAWVGVVSFEATTDGTNWVSIFGYAAGTGSSLLTADQTQISSTGTIFRATVAGFASVRIRLSTATSGALAVTAILTSATSGVFLNFPLPTGTNVIGSVVSAPSSAAANGLTPIVSTTAEATHVLKATPGNLYSVYAVNLTATAGFLTVLNLTSAPGDGAITPLDVAVLPANGSANISFGSGPPGVYSVGITAVLTSAATPFTKTTGVITGFIHGAVA